MPFLLYLCTMNFLKKILCSVAFLLCFCLPRVYGQSDSVEISLLTCGPYHEVYSLYGHTAIRIKNVKKDVDMVVNYGVFDFDKPHFIWRFIFGLTDYEMGVAPFDLFCREFSNEGRYIVQQVLDLTDEDKRRILDAIGRNALPENRVYRYNYFYDNCTTRARNMLIGHMDGRIEYDKRGTEDVLTFREMIHSYNEKQLWARFGNDVFLGVMADRNTSLIERQFLPEHLMRDFSKATVVGKDGKQRLLVKDTSTVLEGNTVSQGENFPLRPRDVMLILLLITVILTVAERKKRIFWGFDALLLFFTGATGVLLTMMIFSQHPAVSLNLQILMLNPLSLFCLFPVVKRARKKQGFWFWKVWVGLIVCFFIGNIFQSYAEGMNILALSLLIRCCANIWRGKAISAKHGG